LQGLWLDVGFGAAEEVDGESGGFAPAPPAPPGAGDGVEADLVGGGEFCGAVLGLDDGDGAVGGGDADGAIAPPFVVADVPEFGGGAGAEHFGEADVVADAGLLDDVLQEDEEGGVHPPVGFDLGAEGEEVAAGPPAGSAAEVFVGDEAGFGGGDEVDEIGVFFEHQCFGEAEGAEFDKLHDWVFAFPAEDGGVFDFASDVEAADVDGAGPSPGDGWADEEGVGLGHVGEWRGEAVEDDEVGLTSPTEAGGVGGGGDDLSVEGANADAGFDEIFEHSATVGDEEDFDFACGFEECVGGVIEGEVVVGGVGDDEEFAGVGDDGFEGDGALAVRGECDGFGLTWEEIVFGVECEDDADFLFDIPGVLDADEDFIGAGLFGDGRDGELGDADAVVGFADFDELEEAVGSGCPSTGGVVVGVHGVWDADAGAVGEEPDLAGGEGVVSGGSGIGVDASEAGGGEEERFVEVGGGVGGFDFVDFGIEFGLGVGEADASVVETAAVGDEHEAVAGSHGVDEFFGLVLGAVESGWSAVVVGLHGGGGVDDDDAGVGLGGFGLDDGAHECEDEGGEDEELEEEEEVAAEFLEGGAGAHVSEGFGPEECGGDGEVGALDAQDVEEDEGEGEESEPGPGGREEAKPVHSWFRKSRLLDVS